MTQPTAPDEVRAFDILTRMQKNKRVGIIDTIYIYLWVFAVTEWGEATRATMWTFAVTVILLYPISHVIPSIVVTTIVSFAIALCVVICYESVFGFLLALILLPLVGMGLLIYFGLHYVGVI